MTKKSRWSQALAVALPVLIGLVGIPTAGAEWKYKEIRRQLDPKQEKLALDFNKGTNKDVAEGRKAIEETCLAYIARFTTSYDQALPRFDTVRRQLDALLIEGIPRQPPEARETLVATLVRAAGAISESNEYSPAARINCALILGDLDEARDPRQNLRKPSAAAREKLIQIQAMPDAPIYLKTVALQGLERHARETGNGWDDATKSKVLQAAMTFAARKPARDTERQANTWLTRRGLDLVRSLRSKEAIGPALGFLSDPEELPSLRFSALEYLLTQDLNNLSAEQKKQYVLGVAQFLRSQLINWYYGENDKQKRSSGESAGGGSGMGPGSGFGFGAGGGPGDGGGLDSGFAGGLSGAGGTGPGGRGSGSTRRAIDSQTWEARMARRQINQITQYVRFSLEGKRIGSDTVRTQSYLTAPNIGVGPEYNLPGLIQLIDQVQEHANNVDRITTVQSLMNETRRDIEAIMRFTKEMPGFLERYLAEGDGEDELQEVDESDPPGDAADGEGGDAGNNDAGQDDGTQGDAP